MPNLQLIQDCLVVGILIVALIGAIVFVLAYARKVKLDGTAQINAHSGDSETLTVNLNLPSSLSYEEKQARVFEGFALVAARRKATHEAMEEIRKKAREEAEARQAIQQEAVEGEKHPALQALPPAEGQS